MGADADVGYSRPWESAQVERGWCSWRGTQLTKCKQHVEKVWVQLIKKPGFPGFLGARCMGSGAIHLS